MRPANDADTSEPAVMVTLDDVSRLIRTRRTSMLVDRDRGVPMSLVRQLCDLAQWAPNHKRTWPFRFAVFSGDGRVRLGQAFAADMADRDVGDSNKREKTSTKYLRTPAIVVFGSAAHEDPALHAENRDAVAAGIQNFMLAATAAGLATYWGSAPIKDSPRVLDLCGFEADVRIINVMYVGWASSVVSAPDRPSVQVTVVDS